MERFHRTLSARSVAAQTYVSAFLPDPSVRFKDRQCFVLSSAGIRDHSLAYVALSRVRTLGGLQMLSLPDLKDIIKPVNPVVERFYEVSLLLHG